MADGEVSDFGLSDAGCLIESRDEAAEVVELEPIDRDDDETVCGRG